MNAIDLLKQDHRIVDALFKEVESTPPSKHEALFKRINGELSTHAHVEEKIFYPAVKKAGDKELKDYVLESIEEHLQMKMFLGQLEGMSSKKENFEAKMKVLIEDTRHHVKEEENEWFPKAESKLSSEQLEKLGTRMEAEKKRYQQSNGIKPEPRDMADGAITKLMNKAVDAVSGLVAGGSGGKKASGSGSRSTGAKAAGKSSGGTKSKSTSAPKSSATGSRSTAARSSASSGSSKRASSNGSSGSKSSASKKGSTSSTSKTAGAASKSGASKSGSKSGSSKRTTARA